LVKAARPRRAFSRKSERGATVLVTVMVTLLLTSIGIFAIRNIGKVDQAVGFSRQSAQTLAVAELGTTAALAQVAVLGAEFYAGQMDAGGTCDANGSFPVNEATCYRMTEREIESVTSNGGGETLFEPAVSGSETGSFGLLGNSMGYVSIEMTEKYKTNFPVPGQRAGDTSYVTVTMTTTGQVRPQESTANQCVGTALATSKKVMRAHTIIGPLLSQPQ
jgi:hypothetical protein